MRLDMSNPLRDPGQSYPFRADLQVEGLTYLDDPVTFENVHIEGDLVGTGRGVSMHAVLTADVVSRCALCLEEARIHVQADIENRFSRTPNEDEDEYLIEGYAADLTKPALDALILELPMRFLCRPDCRGLCPVCGKNRNEGDCGCAAEVGQAEETEGETEY